MGRNFLSNEIKITKPYHHRARSRHLLQVLMPGRFAPPSPCLFVLLSHFVKDLGV